MSHCPPCFLFSQYNGEKSDSKNFILQKVVNFVNEIDSHRAFLTVQETLSFAFRAAYGKTSLNDEVTERSQDASMIQVKLNSMYKIDAELLI